MIKSIQSSNNNHENLEQSLNGLISLVSHAYDKTQVQAISLEFINLLTNILVNSLKFASSMIQFGNFLAKIGVKELSTQNVINEWKTFVLL